MLIRALLAASAAALAIASPVQADPGGHGGGHGGGGGGPHGGSAPTANPGGGGHGGGGGGHGGGGGGGPHGGGGPPPFAGGGGHGGGPHWSGAAPAFGGGGRGHGGAPAFIGGGRAHGHAGGYSAAPMRFSHQGMRGLGQQQARGGGHQRFRMAQRQQGRGFARQERGAAHQQAHAFAQRQGRGFGRQQSQAFAQHGRHGFGRQQMRSLAQRPARAFAGQAGGRLAQQGMAPNRQQMRSNGMAATRQQMGGQQIAAQQLPLQQLGGHGQRLNGQNFAAAGPAPNWNSASPYAGLAYGNNVQVLPVQQVQGFIGEPVAQVTSIAPLSPIPADIAYLYPATPDYYYEWGDGYLYQIDRSDNLIAALVPLMAGGYLPGQYLPAPYMASYVPDYYGFDSFYPDYGDLCNRYYGGVIYQVDCADGYVESVVPMYAGGYGVGQLLPAAYSYYNVPVQYRSTYYDTADSGYWYSPGAIYRYDPHTSVITSVAALMAPGFTIGQPLPVGYDVYNVPLAYRATYYDTPSAWYRYNNGYIYQIDPLTQIVTAVVASLLT